MVKKFDDVRMKKVAVLGATGTIGSFSLDVLKRMKEFKVVGVSAHKNLKKILDVKKRFPSVKTALTGFKNDDVNFSGENAIKELLESIKPDYVIVGVSGFSGLKHALTACKYSKRLCLANKECVVAGGTFFFSEVKKRSCEVIPVDSEHNGLFQLLEHVKKEDVKSVTLTASGGALKQVPIDEFPNVTPKMVLNHPVWRMGNRITVDSSTMFNKGLEVMEASFLFDFNEEKIDVLVHPQGKVHAMITLKDGTSMLHFSESDMRIPIAYALNYPRRVGLFNELIPNEKLEFHKPDFRRYPALKLAYQVLKAGDGYRVVYNAADEVAVQAFLNGRLKFTQIYETVYKVLQKNWPKKLNSYDEIEAVDIKARRITKEMIS